MRTHTLKVWPEPFEALKDGRKRFEFRRDDRGFAVGDTLDLEWWDPNTRDYTDENGNYYTLSFTVTYIARGQWGIPEGYVVMGIAPASPEEASNA